ncbi:MAG: glycosyltransferase family A protein [Tetrasphaera sp.]
MDSPPLIDVVVATNRCSPFLAETLDSVLAQTWTHWRLTLVDDGSPDPEANAAALSAVSRARIVRQRPAGLAAARNTGIAATTGEFLVFLDDDDTWEPERLERQAVALQASPDAVAACSGGSYIAADGTPFGEGWHARPAATSTFLRGLAELPRITTLMVRRSAIVAVGGFDPRYSSAEDIDLALKLVRLGQVIPIDEPLVRYRRHSDNMTVTMPSLVMQRNFETVLLTQAAAVRGAGDTQAADHLSEFLTRVRRQHAAELHRRIAIHAREHRLAPIARDLVWTVPRAPLAALSGAGRAILRWVRRRR